jgi:hypothetical protein
MNALIGVWRVTLSATMSRPHDKWAGPQKKNGELLALASGDFDVFITVDRNLAFQQNLTGKPIAVVILQARTNRLVDLRSLVPELLETLDSVQVGTVNFVGRK